MSKMTKSIVVCFMSEIHSYFLGQDGVTGKDGVTGINQNDKNVEITFEGDKMLFFNNVQSCQRITWVNDEVENEV